MSQDLYIRLVIIISIGGFFLGSVLFAKILPRVVRGIDIEAVSEDGNPGVSNVFKHCGIPLGIACAICDFGKAFAPIVVANALIPMEVRTPLYAMVICSGVLGHIFSVFHHGNGGMGVASLWGTLFAVFFECQLIFVLIIIYVVIRYICRVHHQHLRTILCFGIFLTFTAIFVPDMIYKTAYIILSAVICAKSFYIACRQRNTEKMELKEG